MEQPTKRMPRYSCQLWIFYFQSSGRFSIVNCQADEIVDVINDMQQAIVSPFYSKLLFHLSHIFAVPRLLRARPGREGGEDERGTGHQSASGASQVEKKLSYFPPLFTF